MKPSHCIGCPLEKIGQGYVSGSGKPGSVLLIGEALGVREVEQGKPFVGLAGMGLMRVLALLGKRREDFSITNVIRCRPPGDKLVGAPYEQQAIACCSEVLDQTIKQLSPRAIVTLGNTALKRVLGLEGILEKRAPKRGYVYESPDLPCPVVPTFHPSVLIRGEARLMPAMMMDIAKAISIAEGGARTDKKPDYLEDPTLPQFQEWVEKAREVCLSPWPWPGSVCLSADIETSSSTRTSEEDEGVGFSEITRISFSYKAHSAVSVPWREDTIPLIRAVLEMPWEYTIFWNEDFDAPRLRAAGIRLGKILDGMYAWHFLQSDVPKSLGFVGSFLTRMPEWKSKSDFYPSWYSCCDADAAFRCTEAIVSDLHNQGRWGVFLRDHVELIPVLREMGSKGLRVDLAEREHFTEQTTSALAEFHAEVQRVVPSDLKPLLTRKQFTVEREGRRRLLKASDPSAPDTFLDEEGNCWLRSHKLWTRRDDFSPSNPHHMRRYIQGRGHPMPRNKKTGAPTTDEDGLQKLAKHYPRDPLYALAVNYRKRETLLQTFINGYVPNADGRICTTYTHKPSTWRLASQDVNLQNIPKRGPLAKEFRRMFIPDEGCLLVEIDYSGIEALLVGWFAKDDTYMRAARFSVHAILAGIMLGQPIDLGGADADINEAIRTLKREDPDVYDRAKRVVHSSNYGGSARILRLTYPEDFKTEKEAKQIQDLYFKTIAEKVRAWQRKTLLQAHNKHYLESPMGYRHYFWDVIGWDGKPGTSAKSALAFLPQNTAAAIISRAIAAIAANSEYRPMLRLQIHDSLIFAVPDEQHWEEKIAWLNQTMRAPIPELDGLSVGTEVLISRTNWSEMEVFHV